MGGIMGAQRIAVLAVMLALSACIDSAEAEALCGADELQDLVGQPATRLETMRFGTEVRVIHPGMAVTMDYSAGRLNIDVDAAGSIVRVYCG